MLRSLFASVIVFTLLGRTSAQPYGCTARAADYPVLETAAQLSSTSITPSAKPASGILYIPIVVHVLYQSGVQNLPDALILNYISELNKGFRAQHSVPFTPRPIFDSLWADMEIEFCLVTVDPTGAPSTGITHTQTSVFFSSIDLENIKHSSTGGEDAWPVANYLNIWFAPLSGPTLGNTVNNNIYSDPDATEGIVINSAYPELAINDLIHEAGHYVGLLHTFDNAAEMVDDTPYEGTGGHTYINSVAASCSTGDLDSNTSLTESAYWGSKNPPDMIENFMGYDRPCQFMFTKGQKARAHNILSTYYDALTTSTCISATQVVGRRNGKDHQLRAYYSGNYVHVSGQGFQQGAKYEIYTAAGIKIAEGVLPVSDKAIEQTFSAGVYTVRAGGCMTKLIVW